MDGSPPVKLDSKVSQETQTSKRRKVIEKTVVRVRIGTNAGNLKNEGPPSDFWSWRKYGQKPIKGSPYPRAYYKCSTSKGCSAKKQVERCRTDASLIIITYTSSHDHPGPDLHPTNLKQEPIEYQTKHNEDHPRTPKLEQSQERQERKADEQNQPIRIAGEENPRKGLNFHYLQSPISCHEDIMINQENHFTENPEKTHDTLGIILDEVPISGHHQTMTCSTSKSEQNDFFDELEELPNSSPFTSLMQNNFFDERIPVVPS